MRLFLLEGQPAITDPDGTARNGMARLGALFARDEVNSATSFALADTHLLFPNRLYNHFETPTKLIKLRAPLPSLLRRPELYQHMRVKEGCQMALLRLGGLLRSSPHPHPHLNPHLIPDPDPNPNPNPNPTPDPNRDPSQAGCCAPSPSGSRTRSGLGLRVKG